MGADFYDLVLIVRHLALIGHAFSYGFNFGINGSNRLYYEYISGGENTYYDEEGTEIRTLCKRIEESSGEDTEAVQELKEITQRLVVKEPLCLYKEAFFFKLIKTLWGQFENCFRCYGWRPWSCGGKPQKL